MSDYVLKLSEAEIARYEFMARAALEMERDLWAAAGIREGAVVADVGCGPGAVSVLLGQLVGPTGRVLAVDREAEAVAAARAGARRAQAVNMDVSVGAADSTGIAPGTVDVVMVRHVLAHNGGRESAIVSHAASLTRPGGCVYLADIEWEGIRMRPAEPDIDDLASRYAHWHRGEGNDLSVGLRLAELLAGAGLEVIEFEGRYQIFELPAGIRPPSWAARDAIVAAGLATSEDVARWDQAFERVDAATPRPTSFVPLFFAIGRSPAS